MADILDIDTIQQRTKQPPTQTPPRRYIRSLGQAAQHLVEQIQNAEGRFMFGIRPVDIMVRGLGPGELCMFTGKSHSAKTQVLLNAVANNPESRVLWVTPDEVAELVLLKLFAMVEHVNPEDLEEKIKDGDQQMIDTLMTFANERFPNFQVVDDTVDQYQLEIAISESTDHWGEPPQLVVFDYLELMPTTDGESTGVVSNARAMKALAKEHEIPIVVVHQASRSGGKRGQAAGIDGMRYGGEAESNFVIECFRKVDDESADEYTRNQQRSVVTVNVAKNKNPPSHKGMVDLFLHPNFGYVREIRDGDVGTPQEFTRPSFTRDTAARESQSQMISRLRAERAATETPSVVPPGSERDDDSF